MAGVFRAGANWLKMAWVTQPVLFLSCVLGGVGMPSACEDSERVPVYLSALHALHCRATDRPPVPGLVQVGGGEEELADPLQE